MKSVTVNAHITYQVLIERGLISKAGEIIYDKIYQGKSADKIKALVVLNSDLIKYSDTLIMSLANKGFQIHIQEVPSGEDCKNFHIVSLILKKMIDIDFAREDVMISFGGGSVGDVVAFVASIYKRGTRFVNIPTTLLAMVDSAIGGKTAINYDNIKNIVGSFYQPNLVIEDIDLLSTIEGKNLRSGIGELIKYGVIDKSIFYKLFAEVKLNNIEDMIYECVCLKAKFVEQDEYDENKRIILNLGHTIGHAIETLSGFRTPHGIAVACGIMCIARCVDNESGTKIADKISHVLDIQGILTEIPYSADEILKIIAKDKKWAYGKLTLIIFDDIGNCKLRSFTPKELDKFIRGGFYAR